MPTLISQLCQRLSHARDPGVDVVETIRRWLDDPPLAMALLDRVVDGAIIQRFKGKSYRAHRAEQQAQRGKKGGARGRKS